jgi:ribosomal subunit interface protein
MQTTITARHGEIPAELKARAEQVLERLSKRATRPTSAHLTFDTGAPGASAEIVINAAHGAVHVAKAEAEDHRTALDRVSAKITRQLDKADGRPAAVRRKRSGAVES